MELGAVPQGTTETRFTVWAPRAETVDLWLTDTDHSIDMAPCGNGYFRVTAPCGPGARYRYRLDGSADYADPASRAQPDGVHGPSAVVDLTAYRWHDEGFVPTPLPDSVLYELHVGTFTEQGTFAAATARLDDLVELRVTTMEVMPVAQFPGQRNWGYDGVFPFAVQQSYGGAAGLQEFVDECHARGISVVLDVVFNHLGPEGNVLGAFGPYFTGRYRTPWGDAVNLDGADSDQVREYFGANVRQWCTDFHIDGLRLDAVHELIDRTAVPFLAELVEVAEDIEEESGRRVILIAESADNDPRMVTRTEAGGLGMDAQWNDDFHHAVHVALTGEAHGYYLDYSGLEDVARAMDQGFVYQGEHSRFRRRHHGAPSVGVDPQRFVVYVQNHDQVGNRPDGARLAGMVTAEQRRLAAALLLLSPGVPMLFMGEEYGETAPFPYFVDHGDPGLIDAVRKGRAEEHAGDDAADRAPDPAASATFASAKLDWSARREHGRRELWELYRDLITLRTNEPAFRRSSRAASRAHAEAGVVTLTRTHGRMTVVALFNLTSDEAVGHLDRGHRWSELLNATADTEPAPAPNGEVPLQPWGFRVYRAPSTPHLVAGVP
ncbi:MAG TPA: malto-oligosyltrehalose trehalohydrolase [Acidimicrobiales bacterium]|nr:malto-oligosyltrehalose trehalohydrolase [Acidimicrobiales bacterium]